MVDENIGILGHVLAIVGEILALGFFSYIFWYDLFVGFEGASKGMGGWGATFSGVSLLLLIWTSYSLAKAQHV